MSKQNKGSEPIKVTDKRIFTADGDIREEFKESVTPVVAPPQAAPAEAAAAPPSPEPPRSEPAARPAERRKSVRDKAENPGTPFSLFLETLVINAYMSLGMIRNPYQQEGGVDLEAGRQMIEIISMLSEKTKGNLTEDEQDYLATHLGELKLAFVQRSKTI